MTLLNLPALFQNDMQFGLQVQMPILRVLSSCISMTVCDHLEAFILWLVSQSIYNPDFCSNIISNP